MGGPRHEPTSSTRNTVRSHAMAGTPQQKIADLMGISKNTLRKFYKDELNLGISQANAVVARGLYSAASGEDFREGIGGYSDFLRAAMFWAKTRMGWRETDGLLGNTGKEENGMPSKITIEFVESDGDGRESK